MWIIIYTLQLDKLTDTIVMSSSRSTIYFEWFFASITFAFNPFSQKECLEKYLKKWKSVLFQSRYLIWWSMKSQIFLMCPKGKWCLFAEQLLQEIRWAKKAYPELIIMCHTQICANTCIHCVPIGLLFCEIWENSWKVKESPILSPLTSESLPLTIIYEIFRCENM